MLWGGLLVGVCHTAWKAYLWAPEVSVLLSGVGFFAIETYELIAIGAGLLLALACGSALIWLRLRND
jgi:hypothetical protein